MTDSEAFIANLAREFFDLSTALTAIVNDYADTDRAWYAVGVHIHNFMEEYSPMVIPDHLVDQVLAVRYNILIAFIIGSDEFTDPYMRGLYAFRNLTEFGIPVNFVESPEEIHSRWFVI